MSTEANLERRRRKLGMSYNAIARRSGVSLATVARMFRSGLDHATFANVVAVATALGMRVEFTEVMPTHEMRRQEALNRAKRLVGIVQATSALEDQGIDEQGKDDMISQVVYQLMAQPKSKLWAKGAR